MPVVLGLIAGLLFGIGVTVSQMINPAKILDFLDFAGAAQGVWDPSLALVMAGALAVTFVGYRWVFRRNAPLLASSFALPKASGIDLRLIGGAALFGLGWGLTGFCPGPALAALATGTGKAFLFVGAMLVGMAVNRYLFERQAPAAGPAVGTGPTAATESSPSR